MSRKSFGHWGENLAVEFLVRHGFTVVSRNYYCQEGEIDIIAFKNDEWWFVEVKTRRSVTAGEPEEAVDDAKIEKMTAAALDYLDKRDEEPISWQLGLVSVKVVGRNKVKVSFLVL